MPPTTAGINVTTAYPRSEREMATLLFTRYLLDRYATDHSLMPRPDTVTGKPEIEREIIHMADISKKGMSKPSERDIK